MRRHGSIPQNFGEQLRAMLQPGRGVSVEQSLGGRAQSGPGKRREGPKQRLLCQGCYEVGRGKEGAGRGEGRREEGSAGREAQVADSESVLETQPV